MTAVAAKVKEERGHFSCLSCGDALRFDTESQQLKCGSCGTEQDIEQLDETPNELPFDEYDEEDDVDRAEDWGEEQQSVQCESCGATHLIPARQTATECPFCGSPHVLSQGEDDAIRPESLIPFQISDKEAYRLFHRWKRKRWFIPNAFKYMDIASKLKGIYVPYWTFDTYTYSVYSAEVGVWHYRTETRTREVNGKTETYTEQVRYTVWHWTRGEYERDFDDLLVPASGYYDDSLLRKLGDFDLADGLTGYKPEYLSGFIAEKYTVDRDEGWSRARQEADDLLESDIRSIIGGDEIRHFCVRTCYEDKTYKHMLLPVWNTAYTYKGKSYSYMVNGQTGTVSASVPRSAWKITLFVLFCLAVAGAAVYWLYGSGILETQI